VAGCYAIRVAIGNAASTWQHVEKTWHAVTQR
jgi:hypothetical protein